AAAAGRGRRSPVALSLTNDSIRLVRFAARTNDETQTELVEGAHADTRPRRGKTCRVLPRQDLPQWSRRCQRRLQINDLQLWHPYCFLGGTMSIGVYQSAASLSALE